MSSIEKNIMVIGLMNDQYKGWPISNEIEKQGHTAIRVSSDIREIDHKVDYHVLDNVRDNTHSLNEIHKHQIGFRTESVKNIIEDIGKPVDAILYIQGHDIIFDFKDVNIPQYYYYTETIRPQIPLNMDMKGLFYAFYGGKRRLENAHPYEVHTSWIQDLIPHGIDLEIFPEPKPYDEREFQIGFMGSLNIIASKDPIEKKIYKTRRRIIRNLKLEFEMEIAAPRQTFEKYVEFMNNTKYALNIGVAEAGINLRQFEALACGCILFQMNYEGLEKLGYIDSYNCMIFNDLAELKRKINWLLRNPAKEAEILENGIKLSEAHTYKTRVDQMLSRIVDEDFTEREQGNIDWLATQNQLNVLYNAREYDKINKYWTALSPLKVVAEDVIVS